MQLKTNVKPLHGQSVAARGWRGSPRRSESFRLRRFLAATGVWLVLWLPAARAQVTHAVRTLPEGVVMSNEVVHVRVDLSLGEPQPDSLVLTEVLPAGWEVTNATWKGSPLAPAHPTNDTFKWVFGIDPPVQKGSLEYDTRAVGATGSVCAITGTVSWLAGSYEVCRTEGDEEVRISAIQDSDRDGMPDDWEILHGLCPTNAADGPAHADADGMCNADEYAADTDPTRADSVLQLNRILAGSGWLRIEWQGGIWATQYVERSGSLADGAWARVHTRAPPTETAGVYEEAETGGPGGFFYRVRAAR